jgi:hypothetical protein
LVLFSKIYAVGAVLVIIPIVVVLVLPIVNAGLFLFVSVVVLRRRARYNCHGCGQCGTQEKKTYVSVSGFHVVLLLSQRNPIPVLGWRQYARSLSPKMYDRRHVRGTAKLAHFFEFESLAPKDICVINPDCGHSLPKPAQSGSSSPLSQPVGAFRS